MGQTWHAPAGAPRPAHRMGLYLRRDLSREGEGAGLVMPWCDTDAMAAHLIEISAAVDPGAHAVLIVDQAGWHLTPKLAIPDNITVLALPPRSPELNPVENVWQFMRDNWLSNRIFKSTKIVALCCQAWNNLINHGRSCPSACANVLITVGMTHVGGRSMWFSLRFAMDDLLRSRRCWLEVFDNQRLGMLATGRAGRREFSTIAGTAAHIRTRRKDLVFSFAISLDETTVGRLSASPRLIRAKR